MAVRGQGLKVAALVPEEIEEVTEGVQEYASAAFMFNGVLCQVPDLDSFQKKVTVSQMVA